ncbi:SNF1-interacting protein [Basidiobolus ranarum]|uniref:SNF1-interacting protein n=1 Tax=Basidiobolus ranarum TaxID=34480 RepID=A0ABR2WPI2_9FUNG
MGNIQTKRDASLVDGGGFTPNGIYTAEQDFDHRVVRKLIVERKISPFYRGLAETNDIQKEQSTIGLSKRFLSNAKSASCISKNKLEGCKVSPVDLYRNAVECPICFLYYPKNINYTRCCRQPICTECFVQMKRLNNTTSATCPYCVEPNFGIVYEAPFDVTFYTGGYKSTVLSKDTVKVRKGSIHHNSPEVVTSDDIRPDYVRRLHISSLGNRGFHRHANLSLARRLFHPRLSSRRNNSSQPTAELSSDNNEQVDMALEELMIMEAIRQSLRQHGIDERSTDAIHRDSSSEEHYVLDDLFNDHSSTRNNPHVISDDEEIRSLASSHQSVSGSEGHGGTRNKPTVQVREIGVTNGNSLT